MSSRDDPILGHLTVRVEKKEEQKEISQSCRSASLFTCLEIFTLLRGSVQQCCSPWAIIAFNGRRQRLEVDGLEIFWLIKIKFDSTNNVCEILRRNRPHGNYPRVLSPQFYLQNIPNSLSGSTHFYDQWLRQRMRSGAKTWLLGIALTMNFVL